MDKDLYTMVGLAEGFVEGTELEVIEAWQYLHDSGHAYKLQGWFGRTAQALLEEGIIFEVKYKGHVCISFSNIFFNFGFCFRIIS